MTKHKKEEGEIYMVLMRATIYDQDFAREIEGGRYTRTQLLDKLQEPIDSYTKLQLLDKLIESIELRQEGSDILGYQKFQFMPLHRFTDACNDEELALDEMFIAYVYLIPKIYHVVTSHGTTQDILIGDFGKVIESFDPNQCCKDSNPERCPGAITRFDLNEWREYWGQDEIPDYLDILDLGGQFRDGTTFEAEPEWRGKNKGECENE